MRTRKKEKYELFWGAVVVTVSTVTQMIIGFSTWNEKYGSTKEMTIKVCEHMAVWFV